VGDDQRHEYEHRERITSENTASCETDRPGPTEVDLA
jgi:hypothetical protein